jgi:Protein of unknown function (DUF1091)
MSFFHLDDLKNPFSYVLNGKYTIKIPLGDNINMQMAALNYNGGGYKMIAEKTFEGFCRSLYNDTIREYYEEFQEYQEVNIPWKTCPYPTGTNVLTNYVFQDYGDYLPPYLPGSEKWKVEIRYVEKGEVLGGYNIYAIMRNMRSLMGS